MRDAGKLKIYKLTNTAEAGLMPTEKLVEVCETYYDERRVGITRAYAALGAKQRIDSLVVAYNVNLPTDAEYCILEDGLQYQITLKQKENDNMVLTLERLEEFYDVADA